MRLNNLEQFTYDADREGSDFIDSLPEPEIKTTEDLIAAVTPAAPAAQPMRASGPIGRDGGQATTLSQTQGYGMVPVYQEQGRMSERKDEFGNPLEPVLLGYEFNPTAAGLTIEDAPKSPEILAIEKQLGKEVNPYYATYSKSVGRGGAEISEPYGPPIGYSYDNGKSQIVSLDTSGQHIGTVDRGNNSGFVNFALSMLSIAYPPIAPFIQGYNAVKAIDSGDTLGFILSAAGAGKSIPGLDASTTKLLNDVSTGARIIKAVESKDPLAIASSMVNLPGVPVDVKNTLDIVNTAKAISRGDINALIGVAQKYGSSVSKTADTVTVDGTIYDINNTPAGNLFDKDGRPLTPEASMGATFEDQMFNNLIEIRNKEKIAALDPSQLAVLNTKAVAGVFRMSDGTYRDQFNNEVDERGNPILGKPFRVDVAGGEPPPEGESVGVSSTAAEEQADREQAARDAIKASERSIEKTLTDAGLVSTDDSVDTATQEQSDREQAARDDIRAQEKVIADKVADDKVATDAGFPNYGSYTQFKGDIAAYNAAKTAADTALAIAVKREALDLRYDVNKDGKITSADALSISKGTPIRSDIDASGRSIEDTLTDAGLVSNTDGIQKLDSVEVTGKGQSQDKVTGKTIEDTLTDAGLVSNTDGIDSLNAVTVLGTKDLKALTTDDISSLTTTDIDTLINTGIDSLDKVTVLGTKDIAALTTDYIDAFINSGLTAITTTDINALDKVTVLGTKDVKALNTDYIDTLTTKDLTALTTKDLTALDKVTILGTKDIAVLNTDYIDTLTTKDLTALTTKDLTALDKVTILGTKDIAALTTDYIDALDKVTILGTKDLTALTTKDLTALTTQSVKTLPKVTLPKITPTKPTDVVGTETKKTTPPEEQFYQTTTQSNPTTPQEIKYFLDMIGSDILPPINKYDPVESLVNPPMSLEELLHHLRS